MQGQEKQTQKEKEEITSLKNKIITIRMILLCLAGIFSAYIPLYLGIHIEWVEATGGLIAFLSLGGLLSLIVLKGLAKYPLTTAFVVAFLMFFFFIWASLSIPNKNATPVMRIIALSLLVSMLGMIYINIGVFILFFEKKFSFIHFSKNIGKIIGFLSVTTLLILTVIQIFNAFHK